jgi:hypothetical protein
MSRTRTSLALVKSPHACWPYPAVVLTRVSPNHPTDFPSDAACNRWRPEIEAAYFVAIVMGARITRLTGPPDGCAR